MVDNLSDQNFLKIIYHVISEVVIEDVMITIQFNVHDIADFGQH